MGVVAISVMSRDPDAVNKLLFSLPIEEPYDLALTGPVVSEKVFEDCGRWMDGACFYYKLTYEPKGSGKLKRRITIILAIFKSPYPSNSPTYTI